MGAGACQNHARFAYGAIAENVNGGDLVDTGKLFAGIAAGLSQFFFGHVNITFIAEAYDLFALEIVSGSARKGRNSTARGVADKFVAIVEGWQIF